MKGIQFPVFLFNQDPKNIIEKWEKKKSGKDAKEGKSSSVHFKDASEVASCVA